MSRATKRARFRRAHQWTYNSSGPDERFGQLPRDILGKILWRFCPRRIIDLAQVNKHWHRVAMSPTYWKPYWELVSPRVRNWIPESWKQLPYHTRLYQVCFRHLFLGSAFSDVMTYLEPNLIGNKWKIERTNGQFTPQTHQSILQVARYFLQPEIRAFTMSAGGDRTELNNIKQQLEQNDVDKLFCSIPNHIHTVRLTTWYTSNAISCITSSSGGCECGPYRSRFSWL